MTSKFRAPAGSVILRIALDERRREESGVRKVIRREAAVVDDQSTRARDNMARAISRHIHRAKCEGPCNRRCVTQATAGRDRQLASVDDAIEHATQLRWITPTGDALHPGHHSKANGFELVGIGAVGHAQANGARKCARHRPVG